jgi:folylpolyglutamate synthase/dihydropteroate synthase
MLRGLASVSDAIILTASRNPRSLSARSLGEQAAQLGVPVATAVDSPAEALAQARDLASPDGVVLVTGSIYLIAELLGGRSAAGRPASML